MSGAANDELKTSQVDVSSTDPEEQSVSSSSPPKQNATPHQAPHLIVVTPDAQNAERMGPRLRAAREAKGMTIEGAARETRIQKDYLRAIEDMMPKLLPGMPRTAYLRGYLTTYARTLGMPDERDVVTRYMTECGLLAVESPTAPVENKDETNQSGPGHTRSARASGGTVGALKALALGGVSALLVIGLVGAAVYFKPWENTPATIRSAQPDAASRVGVVSEGVSAQPDPVFGDMPAAAAPSLSIKAVRRAWIEVRGADGTVYLSKEMAAGQVYVPRSGAGWTVTTRDGGAFEWRLSGQSLGLFSEQGAPVYADSVDAALQRMPVAEPPAAPQP